MALDLSSKTPPPAKKAPQAKKPPVSDARIAERTESISGLFGVGAGLLALFGMTADAGACIEHGEKIAPEAAALADRNEAVAKALDSLAAIGPYAGIIATTVPFILQILVNHGTLKAAPLVSFGVVTPETMQAKLQAKAMQAQAELLRKARDAQQEVREAERELAREMQPTEPEHTAANLVSV